MRLPQMTSAAPTAGNKPQQVRRKKQKEPRIEPGQMKHKLQQVHDTGRQVRVRKSLLKDWCVVNETATNEIIRFTAGIITDPKLNSDARLLPGSPANVAWEATGTLRFTQDLAEFHFVIPDDVNYRGKLRYSQSTQMFYIEGSDFVFTTCDYLIFDQNGDVICCWRETPAGAPAV